MITTTKNECLGYSLILLSVLLVVFALITFNPISQDQNYHHFKDARTVLCIPNFWNVVSNIPFLIVGILGIYKLSYQTTLNINPEIKTAYALLFFATCLVGLGSGYYHFWPTNETLLWDRLPMAIAYMALFMIIIGEFISIKASRIMLFPAVLAGISSVAYWYYTETLGRGDLRFYIIVQFFPLLIAPVILLCFKSQHTKTNSYWLVFTIYIIAKICEMQDENIYVISGFISGHSIKHVLIALGITLLLISYEKREST